MLILFLSISVSSLPCTTATTVINKSAAVEVLIPPPVEPGEAPINIRIIVKNCPASVIFSVGIVLNPAVLGVIEAKRLASTFPFGLKFPMVSGFERSNK